ncbi:hypothetical protein FRC00_002517 [Tulasnella sp. 408]|nr:hypothetical protein FRC00_002517 [Tulasnella sp. 408]
MSGNLDQHEAFKVPLATFETLLNDLRSDKATWDVQSFRKSIYDYANLLKAHLSEEIDTIRPAVLKAKITREQLAAHEQETDKYFIANTSLTKDPQIFFINVIVRGINSVLYYSGQVEPGTSSYKSFLGYTNEVLVYLHKHHLFEEERYFPFLESHLGAGTMSGNVDEHEAFKEPLAAFETLLNDLRSEKATWNVETFRKSIYDFSNLLKVHLSEEIDTLRPAVLKAKITREQFDAFQSESKKYFIANTSLVKDPQFLFINGDGVNGAWFPPLPGPISFVSKALLWHLHSDWWQFGSCDKNMHVKPEFAAYEPVKEK